MNSEIKGKSTPPAKPDARGWSQVVFVLIGVGIIAGGLWSLYMGNAPYHPEDNVTQNGVFLAGD
ncbi:MAG: hypothetical protein ABJL67_19420 [Sulfitobacter sp.]